MARIKTVFEITLAIFGCVLAVFTLLFGDNLYQQITGRSIFQNSPSQTSTNYSSQKITDVYTPTNISTVEVATLISSSTIPTLATEFFVSNIGTPEHPIKVVFTPSSDVNTIISGAEILVKSLEKSTNLSFEISIPTSTNAALELLCDSPQDTIAFIPSLDRFPNQLCDVDVIFIAVRSGQNIPTETISSGLEFSTDLRLKISDALIVFAKTSDWRRSVGGTDFYNWDGITLAP